MKGHNHKDRDRSQSLDVKSAAVAGGPFDGLGFTFQVENMPNPPPKPVPTEQA
jgi:hypothetical protein